VLVKNGNEIKVEVYHLKQTHFDELVILENLSKQKHIGKNLNPKSLKKFQEEFAQKEIIFLNIMTTSKEIAGYLILKKEPSSVQLKRIVIDEKHLGIGKEALGLFEAYCLKHFNATMLWLDVYADNTRAIRLYEKSGYVRYNVGMENHREVWFYRKDLKEII